MLSGGARGIVDFFDVIQARRSVRAFSETPVRREELERVVATARLAPSAGDLQSYRIVVIEDEVTKAALVAAALGQAFVGEAPVVLVFFADPKRSESRYARRGASLFCVQDATIAACYAQLAATAQGLASCWVGAFDETAAAAALRAPPELRPVAIMPIGWAAEEPDRPRRRPIDELVRRGPW
jgi:nitroreductase